jgi:hypothetical protein
LEVRRGESPVAGYRFHVPGEGIAGCQLPVSGFPGPWANKIRPAGAGLLSLLYRINNYCPNAMAKATALFVLGFRITGGATPPVGLIAQYMALPGDSLPQAYII